MTYDQLPVTPAVIKWARLRAGYSIEDLVASFKKIADWESGDSSPTYPQLERLSEKLKLPVAVFFFPEPPNIEPISKSFRTLPESQFKKIPSEVRTMLNKAKALQIGLAELTNGNNPAERSISSDLTPKQRDSVEVTTARVRKYLGISLQEQISWPTVEFALDRWREIFHSVGIFVFKDAFRSNEYSGFCLYDREFPIVYVNNSNSKSRQVFTLFHELAHLLRRTSGIDTVHDYFIDELDDDGRKIEIYCNQFAAKFLVPDEEFDKLLLNLEPSEESASVLARRFHVSREVIYRKLLERDLIAQDEYDRAARLWKSQQSSGSGGNYYYNQIAYLGLPYISLAFDRFYKNQISDSELAEYLNIAPKSLSTFEEEYLRRSA